MSAVDLLATLKAAGVQLYRRGGRLTYAAPARVLTPAVVQELRRNKVALLALLPDDLQRPVVMFRLPCHPAGTWATAIGRPGQTRQALEDGLRERWPDVEIDSTARP